ncbi:thioesterase domain-containing protein [Paenibacillus kobensis]|uniref:thioesterase domain-containing protein n=1 Tax=Paenibacillus kobensis TaxID=59841 RepID=UPI000FD6DD7D|nr:thioesterase domain-containing protein [Paenibacillus kobensis]
MADFLQYVLSEVKQHRLSKAEALDLLRQFQGHALDEKQGEPSAPRLHPLLHHNTSDLSEQRFSSVYTGGEPYWLEDGTTGRKRIPEFVQLELAAAALALSSDTGTTPAIKLRSVAWGEPLAASAMPLEVHTALIKQNDGSIGFEVYSRHKNGEPVVYSQGTIELGQQGSLVQAQDVAALQKANQCQSWSSDECYDAHRRLGTEYPSSLRMVERLWAGDSEALAKLTPTPTDDSGAERSTLSSGVLESALQAVVAFDGRAASLRPNSLDSVEINDFGDSPVWVWVRRASGNGNGNPSGESNRFDIDWCLEDGRSVIRMKGVLLDTTRELEQDQPAPSVPAPKPEGISLRPLTDTYPLEEGGKPSTAGSQDFSQTALQEELAESFAGILDMKRGDVDVDVPYTQFGLDSISGVEWVRDLHSRYGVTVTLADIHANATLRELAAWLAQVLHAEPAAAPSDSPVTFALSDYEPLPAPAPAPAPAKSFVTSSGRRAPLQPLPRPGVAAVASRTQPEFPELIPLNRRSSGRPVFWIHGGSGAVGAYRTIAQEAERPMYGIQPRGWMTGRTPLHGIQAMAAYYVHIIMSVQPQGPYDLGGFSLGGRIAYEVARQLQELGETVHTIVMLDSYLHTPYREALQDADGYRKTIALQAVNTALLSFLPPEPESWANRLIHRDEARVYLQEDSERFIERLFTLAESRGLEGSDASWRDRLTQSIRVQAAYGLDRYEIAPLTAPEETACFYFRCRGESFYGELEPYFSLEETGSEPQSELPYWKAWEEWLPRMSVMTADADSHYKLLSDPRAMDAVRSLCGTLYSLNSPAADTIDNAVRANQESFTIQLNVGAFQ